MSQNATQQRVQCRHCGHFQVLATKVNGRIYHLMQGEQTPGAVGPNLAAGHAPGEHIKRKGKDMLRDPNVNWIRRHVRHLRRYLGPLG